MSDFDGHYPDSPPKVPPKTENFTGTGNRLGNGGGDDDDDDDGRKPNEWKLVDDGRGGIARKKEDYEEDEGLPETGKKSPSLPFVETSEEHLGPSAVPPGPTITDLWGLWEAIPRPSGSAVDLAFASPPPRRLSWAAQPVQFCMSPTPQTPNGTDIPVSQFATAPPKAAPRSILHQPKRGHSGAASSNSLGPGTVLGTPSQRATIFTESRATKKGRDSEEEIPAHSAGIITKEKKKPIVLVEEPDGTTQNSNSLSMVKRTPASGPDEPGGGGDPSEDKGGRAKEEKDDSKEPP